MSKKRALVLVGLFFVAFAQGASVKREIAFYEPEQTVLEGRVTLETFPGRPGYESIKDGDEPETSWILHLTKPIDVQLKPGSVSEIDFAEENVRHLQLIIDDEKLDEKKIGFMVGRTMRISGTLTHQITGHHHSRVMMVVQEAKRVR